jgi:hypothetical protein
MKVLRHKYKHVLLISAILFLALGLLTGALLFQSTNRPPQFAFSPTPTVVPTPKEYREMQPAGRQFESWQTFTDTTLKYQINHPKNIIIDKRQTSEGRITVFIFDEDKTASLPGKVTALYMADTGKRGIDGFTAFSRGDCGKECDISHTNSDWITVNNVYGVKNPLPDDVHNYYLTDKDMTGSVLNAYVGGYIAAEDQAVQKKIDLFEEMIKTIRFAR